MSGYLAIVNPAAGGGRCRRAYPPALDELRAAGLEIAVAETSAPGDATRLARQAYGEGRRDFIAVGGDGTSFEVVNGLFPEAAEQGEPVSLGFLPLGTGNSFLRDFTDEGAAYSLRALARGQTRPCDVVSVEHTRGVLYYINILSIGFVADVCTTANDHFKWMGAGGYSAGVLVQLAGLKSYRLPMRINGSDAWDRDPTCFVSINNSRFTGGQMMMAPSADTADGAADLVRVGALGRLDLLRTFPKIFKGTHVGHAAVSVTRVQEIDFDLERDVDIMIDGEVLRVRPTRLSLLPGALTVRV